MSFNDIKVTLMFVYKSQRKKNFLIDNEDELSNQLQKLLK